MKAFKKLFFLLTLAAFTAASIFIGVKLARAEACADIGNVNDRIKCYEDELSKLGNQSKTLSNQIAQFDAQIRLATLKITQTEEKITLLGGRIDQLEGSLDALSKAFSSRAVETYKMTRLGDPLMVVISAPNLTETISRFHYLQKIQEADRDLLQRLQTAQNTYKGEKTDQEQLQQQLNTQKANLNSQKAAKAALLAVTKNSEKTYQSLLAQALAEYQALQGISAGKGIETEVGKINTGSRIASMIDGPSCNSSNTHLHFWVRQSGEDKNPFNYLKGGISYENCSGSSCGSSDGDAFNPGGSWDWPVNPTIKFNQGYGYTWAVRYTWVGKIYSFHNGIDISGGSLEVRAVQNGTLYKGFYNAGACALKYVRVQHDEGDMSTYYLHVDY